MSPPNRVVIVANSRAASGRLPLNQQLVKSALQGFDVEVHFPESKEEACRITQSLKRGEAKALIVAGGDGTINFLLPHIVAAQVPLLTFPAGTANDLATSLGITPSWQAVKSLLVSGKTRTIDLIKANGSLFATIGGIGVASQAVDWFNNKRHTSEWMKHFNRLSGATLYNVAAASAVTLGKSYCHKMRLTYGDQKDELDVSSLLICNQGEFAKNIGVYKGAVSQDGRFNVSVIERRGRLNLLTKLAKASIGQEIPAHRYFAADYLLVEDLDGREMQVFGDGEILLGASSVEFRIQRQVLEVFGDVRGQKAATA